MAREYSFETMAGLLLALFGRIPAPGDTVRWHDYTFEVVDMDEWRIDKILILPVRLQPNEQTDDVPTNSAVLVPPPPDSTHLF